MVDEFRVWAPSGLRCFRNGSCHLTIADDPLERLHEFARAIGLQEIWFQPHAWHPHYDLTAAKRTRALLSGAHFVPAKEQAHRRLRSAR